MCPTCRTVDVLIIDDIEFNLMFLESILASTLLIKADKAVDGRDGVDKVKANHEKTCCKSRYKLVLCDINMPRLDGFGFTEEALAFIQQRKQVDPSTQDLNIVAITAYNTEAIIKQALSVGMLDVLFKPVSLEGIEQALAKFYVNN